MSGLQTQKFDVDLSMAGKLGNEFGLVVLDLAVASPRRMDRLAKTKERMDALKRSPEAAATLARAQAAAGRSKSDR